MAYSGFSVVGNRGPRSGRDQTKQTSQAIQNGDFLVRGTNGVVPATSSAAVGDYVAFATDSVTAPQALPTVPSLEAGIDDVVMAASLNNSDILDNDQLMVLSDSQTVNNTGTTNPAGVVQQVGVVGLPADKTILVKVIR